ncbi:MAG: virulence RhuM family protein [Deltaproteobacteria bacterium]|nr:virulence RhuM family protein [Deltaproteobacteria bacterium]
MAREPTGEIVLYQTEDGRTRLECRFVEETLWLTQALMAELFQKDVRTINEHLRNLFEEGELDPGATIRSFRIVRQEGGRQVSREIEHYSLDAILAVGYRVRSGRGTQFRIWATERLREYLVKGFTMDDERLKNPPVDGSGVPDYFDELLERIRDIRASERRVYLRVREIFALAADYDPKRTDVLAFFQTIQNKLHRIKHKTTYRVEFDNEKLVESCIRALKDAPPIAKARLQWRKADIAIGKAGVEATERDDGAATVALNEGDLELPDLLTDLQDRTQLTRRTIQRILAGSGRLGDFKRNPQQFIELAGEAVNRCKRLAVVDGIKYQRLGDDCYYAQELFEQEELTGYLRNMLHDKNEKCAYEYVVYDSDTEAAFADGLEKNQAIKVYAKLPGWFTVPTPLGSYNPDWAVLVQTDAGERLYFVVETKSGLFVDDLRDRERAKIECGKAHFAALRVGEAPATYVVARHVDDVLDRVGTSGTCAT